jgi:hypothetical protein
MTDRVDELAATLKRTELQRSASIVEPDQPLATFVR